MRRKLGLALALAAPLAASLVAVPQAGADPTEDCDFVPLTYQKNYSAGGEGFTTRADLKVYDLCDAGTITGKVYLRGRNDTQLTDLTPYQPRLAYKRQLDQSYRSGGIDPLARQPVTNGWRPYRVTTDDIDFDPSGGYFMAVRIRWSVTVDGDSFTKTVVCDRIHDTGRNAYLCRNA